MIIIIVQHYYANFSGFLSPMGKNFFTWPIFVATARRLCHNRNMEREKTCCFTGHRAEKLPWRDNERDPACLRLKAAIWDVLVSLYAGGIRHFICGMATGADTYFGEAVVALRDEHPDVTLEAAIPFAGQEQRWPAQWQRRYSRLAEECDTCTVLHQNYTPDCMMDRNRYMVDASQVLVAVYNGAPGGTRSTMLYANHQGLQIIQLPVSPR